jgi:hypothetical protein
VRAIKKVKKFIEKSPNSIEGLTFAKIILALESGEEFPVTELYKLNSDDFDLAIELLRDWRIDRFYIGKAKAFDTATHAKNLS